MPLMMDIKRVSEAFEDTAKKLHRNGNSGLNYPAILDWMVTHWLNACRAIQRGDLITVNKEYATLAEFETGILTSSCVESGYGFPLFRPTNLR